MPVDRQRVARQRTAACLVLGVPLVVLAHLLASPKPAMALLIVLVAAIQVRGESRRRDAIICLALIAVALLDDGWIPLERASVSIIALGLTLGVGTLARQLRDARREAETRASVAMALARVAVLDDDEVTAAAERIVGAIGLDDARLDLAPGTARGDRATPGGRGHLAVPVLVGGSNAGVLRGRTPDGSAPAPLQLELLGLVASHVGRALTNVAEHESEVEVARRLSELDDIRDDLVATVSHELRTPLTVIVGSAETLREHAERLDDRQRHDLLERIVVGGARLTARLDSLLEAATVSTREVRVELDPVAVVPLLDELAATPAGRACRLVVDVATALPPVTADARLLARALAHLVDNVPKHAPGATARLVATDRGDRVRLELCDDGGGIPLDELDSLRTRFRRGGHPYRRGTSGLGLGLSLADALLSAQGYELQLLPPRDGRGTHFAVDLDVVDAATLATPTAHQDLDER